MRDDEWSLALFNSLSKKEVNEDYLFPEAEHYVPANEYDYKNKKKELEELFSDYPDKRSRETLVFRLEHHMAKSYPTVIPCYE